MPRQQEIRNPLLDRILMPTAPTHELAFLYTRLQQHAVQIFRRLARLLLDCCARRYGCCCGSCCVVDKIGGCGRCGGEVGEAELRVC